MPKKIKPTAIPGLSKAITINLKSARNPALEFSIPNATLDSTTVSELKLAVQSRIETKDENGQSTKVPLDKIKVLYKRKPVQSRTIAEALGNDASPGGQVEFGVMVLGGASVVATPPEDTSKHSNATAKETGRDVKQHDIQDTSSTSKAPVNDILSNVTFWNDMEAFLREKIHDDNEASKLRSIFEHAWSSR